MSGPASPAASGPRRYRSLRRSGKARTDRLAACRAPYRGPGTIMATAGDAPPGGRRAVPLARISLKWTGQVYVCLTGVSTRQSPESPGFTGVFGDGRPFATVGRSGEDGVEFSDATK